MANEPAGDKSIQDTLFLSEREARVEDSFAKTIGPELCTRLNRIVKMSEIFAAGHNQITVAARETQAWLEETMLANNEEQLQLQMTETNFFINGQLIRLDARTYSTTLELRTTFLRYSVNQITFLRGIGAQEILSLVSALRDMKSGGSMTLETFKEPHLELASVAEAKHDVGATDDPRRELIEVYAGLLIKTSVFFHRLERGTNPSAKHVKRLVQRICDEIIDGNGDLFVGLINLRCIVGQDFVHAVNTSVYAMMLAHEIRLDRLDVVRCGMTALTQDLDQMANDGDDTIAFETGDETHFRTNLSSVMTLSEMGAADVLSALRLVTSYERGFPFNKPLPASWYKEELRPHLLSRIIEIARHYDVMTQGIEVADPVTPDRALQRMMMKMGSHYDPLLMKLFVNVVGIYPVGSIVELSTREKAIVLRSPEVLTEQSLSNANRPSVRLLGGSDRIIDLALPANQGIRIVRILEEDEVEERPGAFFLF